MKIADLIIAENSGFVVLNKPLVLSFIPGAERKRTSLETLLLKSNIKISLVFFLSLVMHSAMGQMEYPGEYYTIPEHLRESATVVFRGEYTSRRITEVKGTGKNKLTKWKGHYGFAIRNYYTGDLKNPGKDWVEIPDIASFAKTPNGPLLPQYLSNRKEYLVLVAINATQELKSNGKLIRSKGMVLDDKLRFGEIIAIIALSPAEGSP